MVQLLSGLLHFVAFLYFLFHTLVSSKNFSLSKFYSFNRNGLLHEHCSLKMA